MVLEDITLDGEEETKEDAEVAQQLCDLVVEQEPQPSKRKVRRPHRWRSGTKALMEIRRYQKTTNTLIPKRHMYVLFKQIIHSFKDLKIQADAVEMLHAASEEFLVELFKDAEIFAIHAGRIELKKKDIALSAHYIMKGIEKFKYHSK